MLQIQEGRARMTAAKYRLILVYLLNVSDLILTKILLATGLFVEANAVMKPIISGPVSTLLKVGLAAALLLWIFHRLKAANERQLIKAMVMINACLGLYILINFCHMIWLITLLWQAV